MSTFIALIRYFIAISLLLPMYSCAIVAGLFYKPAGWYIIASWNRMFLKIFGVKVNLEYEQQEMDLSSGGVVIGLTQQSILDPTIGICGFSKDVHVHMEYRVCNNSLGRMGIVALWLGNRPPVARPG